MNGPPRLRFYVVALAARRHLICVSTHVRTGFAPDRESMAAQAEEWAREQFPPESGWQSHAVDVRTIDRADLTDALHTTRSPR